MLANTTNIITILLKSLIVALSVFLSPLGERLNIITREKCEWDKDLKACPPNYHHERVLCGIVCVSIHNVSTLTENRSWNHLTDCCLAVVAGSGLCSPNSAG